MNVRLYLLILIVLVSGISEAQTVREAFLDMPDDILLLQTANDRADFIDFTESGMKSVVKDKMDYPAELLVKKDNYLLLKTSVSSDFQMKVLPLNDSVNVICTVTTVYAPAASSRINFYSSQWEELDGSSFLEMPGKEAFLKKDAGTGDGFFLSDIDLYQIKLGQDDDRLEISVSISDYVTEEEKDKLNQILTDKPLTYEWRDASFVRLQE